LIVNYIKSNQVAINVYPIYVNVNYIESNQVAINVIQYMTIVDTVLLNKVFVPNFEARPKSHSGNLPK